MYIRKVLRKYVRAKLPNYRPMVRSVGLITSCHKDIFVEVIGQPSPETFPVLPFTGNCLIMNVEARITDDQEEIDWCCDVLRQMCPHDRKLGYEALFIHHTKLTGPGVERLTRGLFERGLVNQLTSLHVRSYNQITKEEEDKLDTLYKEHGGSYLTVWCSDTFE